MVAKAVISLSVRIPAKLICGWGSQRGVLVAHPSQRHDSSLALGALLLPSHPTFCPTQDIRLFRLWGPCSMPKGRTQVSLSTPFSPPEPRSEPASQGTPGPSQPASSERGATLILKRLLIQWHCLERFKGIDSLILHNSPVKWKGILCFLFQEP